MPNGLSRWRDFKRDRVKEGLNEAYDRCRPSERPIDLDHEPVVVFSDHHKGDRDHADDFWRCEAAYNAALAHYLEHDFRLVVLGDAEELWEEDPEKVFPQYKQTLRLEGRFLAKDRYDRVWGNHDPDWEDADRVSSLLLPALEAGAHQLEVKEGLCLNVTAEGQRGRIFLTHGHQGTLDSDVLAWVAEPAVRIGWASAQRYLRRGWNTPARDNRLRADHDQAMSEWAAHHPDRPVLIAGHTHRPVFWYRDRPPPDLPALEAELQRLRDRGAPPGERAELSSQIEMARALKETTPDLAPTDMETPCYFNTGCCSFADGSVTGIELGGNVIRLVRWPWPYGKQKAVCEVIDEAELSDVLKAVAAGAAPAG